MPIEPLKNTSIVMIVRDELMNPAGGILASVERHAVLVEEMLVMDTGSRDGTRQLLEHLEGSYRNLRVLDHRFDGYAPSRNRAMASLRTTYGLTLDADELLDRTFPSLAIRSLLEAQPQDFVGVSAVRYKVTANEVSKEPCEGNPRLFLAGTVSFAGDIFEQPEYPNGVLIKDQQFRIFHFYPSDYGERTKRLNWYKEEGFQQRIACGIAPSETEGFWEWKAPQRTALEGFGVDLQGIVARLAGLGFAPPIRMLQESHTRLLHPPHH